MADLPPSEPGEGPTPPPPFAAPGGGLPPPPGQPPPGYGAPGYGAPGYGAPGYGAPGYGYPAYGPPAGSKLNPLAIASIVLAGVGIPLMLFCFVGWIAWIVGVVLGIVALSQIKSSGEVQTGRGLAIGGIVSNAVLLAATAIIGLALVFFVGTATTVYCDQDDDGDGIDNCDDDTPFGEDDFDFPTTSTFSIPG